MASSKELDEDLLYATMYSVIEKRKTIPSVLMAKHLDRFEAKLQKLEQMKIELDDNETPIQLKLLSDNTKKQLSNLPPPVELRAIVDQVEHKNRNLTEIEGFLKLKQSWQANSSMSV